MAVKKINCYGCEYRLKKENEVSNADGFLFSASLSKCHWHFFIFQSEKNLKDYGDKIPADKKSAIENACNSLKEAVKNQNIADIDRYNSELEAAWHAASEDMAKAAQGGQQGPQGGAGFNPDGGFGGQQGPQGGDQPDEQ